MEYCTTTLAAMISDRKLPGPEEEKWLMVEEILEGLAHIHRQGVIHRDLKPSNIFVEGGHIKLGDFGLSSGECRKLEK